MINTELIKNILKKKKMSQKDLSEKAGITEAAICRILQNQRNPQGHTLAKLSKALDVSMDVLYED